MSLLIFYSSVTDKGEILGKDVADINIERYLILDAIKRAGR